MRGYELGLRGANLHDLADHRGSVISEPRAHRAGGAPVGQAEGAGMEARSGSGRPRLSETIPGSVLRRLAMCDAPLTRSLTCAASPAFRPPTGAQKESRATSPTRGAENWRPLFFFVMAA